MLLSEAIAAVTTQGGFDTSAASTSDTTIRGWINEAVQEALAESKYRKAIVDLGPTVVDQATYVLPDNVIDVRSLKVGSGRPYMQIPSIEDLWAIQNGDSSVSPGGFIADFSDDADANAAEDNAASVTVTPTPDTADEAITALCAVLPVEIDADTATTYVLPLPRDVVRAIVVDGAIMLGKLRVDEREDLAAPFKGRRDAAVLSLTKRARGRVGGGPVQLRITRPRIR